MYDPVLTIVIHLLQKFHSDRSMLPPEAVKKTSHRILVYFHYVPGKLSDNAGNPLLIRFEVFHILGHASNLGRSTSPSNRAHYVFSKTCKALSITPFKCFSVAMSLRDRPISVRSRAEIDSDSFSLARISFSTS